MIDLYISSVLRQTASFWTSWHQKIICLLPLTPVDVVFFQDELPWGTPIVDLVSLWGNMEKKIYNTTLISVHLKPEPEYV